MITQPTTLSTLIVSNHERLACVLQREIRTHGHFAKTAKSGKEAVAMTGDSTPDLILLDSSLKGENAIAIAKYLSEVRRTPVLMLAGSEEEIAHARSSGVEIRGYLLKPFDTPQFWAGIRDALAAHKGGQGEVSLISAAYDQDAFDEAVCKAAQIAMKRMKCSHLAAFERVAELANARAEALRKEIGEAA
jgi:DNA-binding response OmpR family regulator